MGPSETGTCINFIFIDLTNILLTFFLFILTQSTDNSLTRDSYNNPTSWYDPNANDIRVRKTQSHWSTVRAGLTKSVHNESSDSTTNGIAADDFEKVPLVKKSSKSVIEMRVLETNPDFKYLEESIETINTQLVALVSPEVSFVATTFSYHGGLCIVFSCAPLF